MRRWIPVALIALSTALAMPARAEPPGCTETDFATIVDQTAQGLRDLNTSGERQFREKLTLLGERNKWRKQELEARAAGYLSDARIEEFNREIETLLGRFDTLGNTAGQKADCKRLDELKRVRDRLLTLMGQKSGYMLAKLDAALAPAPAEPPKRKPDPPAKPKPEMETETARAEPKAPVPPLPPTPKPTQQPTETARAAPQQPVPPVPQPPAGSGQQASETARAQPPAQPDPSAPIPLTPAPRDPAGTPGALPPLQSQEVPPLPLPPATDDGFSIKEIREAGRGVFGTISAELAGIINRLSQRLGKPNGYIVGGEGGGAILAGLRYGRGMLHLRDGRTFRIFWQGPSLGFDLGAEGSKTMFLVYNLKDPNAIFGRFRGVDGTAYFAGGIGMTLLVRKDVVLAPIRSGIGLRLGASLAYLKFTERQTWNPF